MKRTSELTPVADLRLKNRGVVENQREPLLMAFMEAAAAAGDQIFAEQPRKNFRQGHKQPDAAIYVGYDLDELRGQHAQGKGGETVQLEWKRAREHLRVPFSYEATIPVNLPEKEAEIPARLTDAYKAFTISARRPPDSRQGLPRHERSMGSGL